MLGELEFNRDKIVRTQSFRTCCSSINDSITPKQTKKLIVDWGGDAVISLHRAIVWLWVAMEWLVTRMETRESFVFLALEARSQCSVFQQGAAKQRLASECF